MQNINTCKNCEKQFQVVDYVHECETCQNEIREAVKTVLADLEWYNAHTIAALLDNHYNGNGDSDKALKAYKAAQFELFGTN